MTKKGFTLMELLVSIFITGMVMLSLVAMWKTSSNHTAQAQRQAIIKNENTIFLRTFYNDFVSASAIICPWGLSGDNANKTPCSPNTYVAVKEAILDPDNPSQIMRLTKPVCGASNNAWGTGENIATDISSRCVKPSYVVYNFRDNGIYKCTGNFLDSTNQNENSTGLSTGLFATINETCSKVNINKERWELIMPYVQNFSLTSPIAQGSVPYPEVLIEYTVNRTFSGDIPPVYFKMKRYFTVKRGL